MSAIPRNKPDHGNPKDVGLTVLQLDTVFPRVAGDVASPETYQAPIVIERIDRASVSRVVTTTPDQHDMTPFMTAAAKINLGIGVTSCGFLGYWQDQLSQHCPRPFIASALSDLPHWQQGYAADEMAVVTFDRDVLSTPLYAPLLQGFSGAIIGLHPDMHLRRVISEDQKELDQSRAEKELIALLDAALNRNKIKALVFECTNLPPYKAAIKSAFDVEIYDILTSIHRRDPDLVKPEFL